jgi:hypothetical protein
MYVLFFIIHDYVYIYNMYIYKEHITCVYYFRFYSCISYFIFLFVCLFLYLFVSFFLCLLVCFFVCLLVRSFVVCLFVGGFSLVNSLLIGKVVSSSNHSPTGTD